MVVETALSCELMLVPKTWLSGDLSPTELWLPRIAWRVITLCKVRIESQYRYIYLQADTGLLIVIMQDYYFRYRSSCGVGTTVTWHFQNRPIYQVHDCRYRAPAAVLLLGTLLTPDTHLYDLVWTDPSTAAV